MEEKTTVSIFKTTLERLKKFKLTKRDSYDEIMNRFMDKGEKVG